MVLKMEMTLVEPDKYAPLCLQCNANPQDYTLSRNATYFTGYCRACWEVGKNILSTDEINVLQSIAGGRKYHLCEDKSDTVHPLSVSGYLQLENDNADWRPFYILSTKGKKVLESEEQS